MVERSYRSLLYGLALLGFLLDQATKYAVFAWLYNDGQGGVRPIVPGAFDLCAQFTTVRYHGHGLLGILRTWGGDVVPRVNRGALFGMGGEAGVWANAVFAGISLAAAVLILFWSARRSLVRDAWLSVALGLVLAGTLGNLYDRLVFDGVRDFLHWHGGFDWPVFNIADCCLVVGAGLLLLQAMLGKAPVPEPQRLQQAAASA